MANTTTDMTEATYSEITDAERIDRALFWSDMLRFHTTQIDWCLKGKPLSPNQLARELSSLQRCVDQIKMHTRELT